MMANEDDLSEREYNNVCEAWGHPNKPTRIELMLRQYEVQRWNKEHEHWPRFKPIPLLAIRHDLGWFYEHFESFAQSFYDRNRG